MALSSSPSPKELHTPQSLFLGFATLEGWADAVDSDRPVYAMPLVEPGLNSGGIQTDELLVVCQQVSDTGDGTIRYCRLRAASLTRCFGNPFDPDWKERDAAWNSLGEAVAAFLHERGFAVQRATVAHPRAYTFLQGRSDTIRYDPQTKRYRGTPNSPAPTGAEPESPT